jgi:hypothetical protein
VPVQQTIAVFLGKSKVVMVDISSRTFSFPAAYVMIYRVFQQREIGLSLESGESGHHKLISVIIEKKNLSIYLFQITEGIWK